MKLQGKGTSQTRAEFMQNMKLPGKVTRPPLPILFKVSLAQNIKENEAFIYGLGNKYVYCKNSFIFFQLKSRLNMRAIWSACIKLGLS